MACALVTVVFSDSDVCAQAIRTVNPYYMPNPPKQPLPPIGPLVENLDTAWPADQVSLVRIWLGHACPFKGYFHCNHRHLDMYSCWGCDHLHPDTCPCGSGESGQGVTGTCRPVKGVHSPSSGHVQLFRVWPLSSWHMSLWIRWVIQFRVCTPLSWHTYLLR